MRNRLGLRSSYSLLYGVRSPESVIEQAASAGARCVAITDRDGLYGVHAALDAAKMAGIRPIVGADLGCEGGRLFVFVRNRDGFGRLCCLLTELRRDAGFDVVSALRADSGGLVLASWSPELLVALAGSVPNLYGAISPTSLGAIASARRLGLPLAALDDATFFGPGDRRLHRVLRSIALGKTVGSLLETDCADPDTEEFLSAEDFERRLSGWPEALRGTERIAESCTFSEIFDGFVFPPYGGDDAVTTLRRRVLVGAERRYGGLPEAVLARIDRELAVIDRKGFAPYFLVMDDIVAMATRTCGRGSGAASIVSYSLGITNVDPIKYNLYFERFLNMARPDPPDIDVDFAWDERDALIRAVIDRFGSSRCARVANHNTFQRRSAFRETAKAYGLPDAEISRAERSLFEQETVLSDPLWSEILAVAGRLEGLPRGLSMHCGGIVIAPRSMTDYAPVEESSEGYPLLAWDKEGTEAAGLVKIDLLGNRSLAVIRDALANLADEGIVIDPILWRPAEDGATVAALARGDSLGVFYIESPAMRQLQKKAGVGDFDHIVIHSSMIRPAANRFIAEYVRRLKGGAWEHLHPLLAPILGETFGILCYQEDVSKTAVALAGFDEVDADGLRKIIAKKGGNSFGSKGRAKLASYQERFFSGCRSKGVDEETIVKVWEMMLSFDGYSFCKPHSASYAMVSFQSAYLRVHHPAAFMAAVLSNQGGYYHPQAYVSEARRMGLDVVGPDVNRSRYQYRGEGRAMVVGFMAIGSLSREATESIIQERTRRGPFSDLGDFSRRMRFNRDDIVSLVASGSLDSISGGASRAEQTRFLLVSQAERGSFRSSQESLFPQDQPPCRPSPRGPGAARTITGRSAIFLSRRGPRPPGELQEEFRSLGFLRDRHPLTLWSSELVAQSRDLARDIPRLLGRRVTLAGWQITRKTVLTMAGLAMEFVSFEDESALYETVLFPAVYERYRKLLFDRQPLLVVGKVVDDGGAISVEIQELSLLANGGKSKY